jgi:alanyl-tRNA synthetase
MLGLREPFMHLLAPDVAHILGTRRSSASIVQIPPLAFLLMLRAGDAYPEIVSRATVSAAVIAAEEEAFQRTLAQVQRGPFLCIYARSLHPLCQVAYLNSPRA